MGEQIESIGVRDIFCCRGPNVAQKEGQQGLLCGSKKETRIVVCCGAWKHIYLYTVFTSSRQEPKQRGPCALDSRCSLRGLWS